VTDEHPEVHASCGCGKASKGPALSQRTREGQGHPPLYLVKAWASPRQTGVSAHTTVSHAAAGTRAGASGANSQWRWWLWRRGQASLNWAQRPVRFWV
jgi:hypothetical protein